MPGSGLSPSIQAAWSALRITLLLMYLTITRKSKGVIQVFLLIFTKHHMDIVFNSTKLSALEIKKTQTKTLIFIQLKNKTKSEKLLSLTKKPIILLLRTLFN